MALEIRFLEIEHHECRDIIIGEIEVPQKSVDSLLERHRAVVFWAEFRRASPGVLDYLGAGPEVCGGGDALARGGLPEGLTEPPVRIVARGAEPVAGDRVGEVVVDDAVVGRVEAGGDGVVVGEGEGGEDRDEALLRLGAAGDEPADVGGLGLELVPEAEAVGGDDDDDGAGELGQGAGGGDGGRGGAGGGGVGDDDGEEDETGAEEGDAVSSGGRGGMKERF